MMAQLRVLEIPEQLPPLRVAQRQSLPMMMMMMISVVRAWPVQPRFDNSHLGPARVLQRVGAALETASLAYT